LLGCGLIDVFDGYIFFVFGDMEGLFVEYVCEIWRGDYLGDFAEIFGDMILELFISFEV